jgi:hypothetical protein
MELIGTKSTKQKKQEKKHNSFESISNNTSKILEKTTLPKDDGTKNGTKKGPKSTKQKTQKYFCENNSYGNSLSFEEKQKKTETGNCLVLLSTKHPLKKYICVCCEYQTDNKSNYNKHLSTKRHQNNIPQTKTKTKRSQHICEDCGKTYLYASGLWKHQQKCSGLSMVTHEAPAVQSDKDIIKLIMEENAKLNAHNAKLYQDMQKQNNKHHEDLQAIIPHVGNNNNNKEFNINIFLNETCKDAMNIKDFVENIKITLEDVVHASEKGVLDSSRKLILQGLQCMELTERPIHCTDSKRNIMYIKDAGLWNKDKQNEELKKILQNISGKHMKGINEWVAKNPNYMDTEKGQQEYVELVRKITTPISESKREIQPTIKNICEETLVE